VVEVDAHDPKLDRSIAIKRSAINRLDKIRWGLILSRLHRETQLPRVSQYERTTPSQRTRRGGGFRDVEA
jgi:hypothetical protein